MKDILQIGKAVADSNKRSKPRKPRKPRTLTPVEVYGKAGSLLADAINKMIVLKSQASAAPDTDCIDYMTDIITATERQLGRLNGCYESARREQEQSEAARVDFNHAGRGAKVVTRGSTRIGTLLHKTHPDANHSSGWYLYIRGETPSTIVAVSYHEFRSVKAAKEAIEKAAALEVSK